MIEIDVRLQRRGFQLQAQCQLSARVTGLLGASGAGKSTLLGIIAGFIKPDSGRVEYDGICLYDSHRGIDIPMSRRRIGMVFQDSRLFPHLSVRENLRYGLELLPQQQQRFEYAHIVELLDIGRLQDQRPHQLSGGEKQRVALGRALLASPRLLLLDEPLAALDMQLKKQILPFLRRVKDEIGIPIIYVSHAINEVLYLTSHVAMMSAGHLLGVGEFHEVMHDDRMLALAHALGLENLLRGRLVVHNADLGYSILELGQQQLFIPLSDTRAGGEVSVSIPASTIALSRERLNGISMQNQLVGTVIALHEADGRVLLSVDIGSPLLVEVTPKALRDMEITQGAQVYCLFKTQSVVLLTQQAEEAFSAGRA